MVLLVSGGRPGWGITHSLLRRWVGPMGWGRCKQWVTDKMKRTQRKATDLVGPLQAHGDAQAVVPDHGERLAQQQDDVLTGLHHLEVGLILHGLLHIHLKDDKHENRESGGQAGVTGSSLCPTRLPATTALWNDKLLTPPGHSMCIPGQHPAWMFLGPSCLSLAKNPMTSGWQQRWQQNHN